MLIDREKAFRELDMPEDLFNELLDMFIEQTEPAINFLREISADTDYEAIRKSAHLLNGSAGNLRIEAVQTMAKKVELAASQKQDMASIKSDIEKLSAIFEEVKKEITHGGA